MPACFLFFCLSLSSFYHHFLRHHHVYSENTKCFKRTKIFHSISVWLLDTENKRRPKEKKNRKKGTMSDQLSSTTSIFGLHLWVVVGICVGASIVLFLFFITLCLASKRSSSSSSKHASKLQHHHHHHHTPTIPVVSKEIQEIQVTPNTHSQIQPDPFSEPEPTPEEESLIRYNRVHVEIGKDHRISYPERFVGSGSGGGGGGEGSRSGGGEAGGSSGGGSGSGSGSGGGGGSSVPEVSHLGWGHWYTLRELEECTNGFDDRNVIGEGGYGIVYYGVLEDNTQVAVKNLLNNRGQAEKEFKVEVEAIGRVRHKNLVRLLGYCAEGAHRMLVYEYVNNGNLEQWLHGDLGPHKPLSWEIRMKIILGTAKGLAYLHEGLEPKVVHRDIKSSNILLDKQWNPKVSDFGLAKLLQSDNSYITTRVMGTFGYVAPEYASTGMLNERSDIYSFGILIMEIISGRNPVDYSRPPEEVNLVDWLKKMVTDKNPEGVLDPKLLEKPISRALKRVLLVALRCVDPTAQKRPKIGHVVHMLEAEDLPFKEDRRGLRDTGRAPRDISSGGLSEKRVSESGANNAHENGPSIDEARTKRLDRGEETVNCPAPV